MSSLKSAATRLSRQMATGSLSHPHAAAGRLARPIAGAPKDARKHVGFPIDHVGVAVPPGGDQPDVFGNRGVCRTGPLAVDNLVKVFRLVCTLRLQNSSQAVLCRPLLHLVVNEPARRLGKSLRENEAPSRQLPSPSLMTCQPTLRFSARGGPWQLLSSFQATLGAASICWSPARSAIDRNLTPFPNTSIPYNSKA